MSGIPASQVEPRLAETEAFVRKATANFDQPLLDDATVTAIARKILKAMKFPLAASSSQEPR